MVGRYAVLTDSVADLPAEWIGRYGITVLPVYVVLGERGYADDATLDRDRFYAQLATGVGRLTTAAPTPEDFRDAYSRLLAAGAVGVLGIFTASRVSSLFSNAYLAAGQMPPGTVRVVDSRQISMGLGWQVVQAVEAFAQGRSLDEVADLLGATRERALVFGVLDSLEHLRRSGRVNLATAWVGDMLRIKPVIVFDAGEARVTGRVRTFWRAVDYVVQRVRELLPLEKLAIIHSRAHLDAIDRLQQALEPMAPLQPIPVVEVGPVFATHIGPGGLGVALVRGV